MYLYQHRSTSHSATKWRLVPTWTITASLREPCPMLDLHALQDDLPLFAYSALKGRSWWSPIFVVNIQTCVGVKADHVTFPPQHRMNRNTVPDCKTPTYISNVSWKLGLQSNHDFCRIIFQHSLIFWKCKKKLLFLLIWMIFFLGGGVMGATYKIDWTRVIGCQ